MQQPINLIPFTFEDLLVGCTDTGGEAASSLQRVGAGGWEGLGRRVDREPRTAPAKVGSLWSNFPKGFRYAAPKHMRPVFWKSDSASKMWGDKRLQERKNTGKLHAPRRPAHKASGERGWGPWLMKTPPFHTPLHRGATRFRSPREPPCWAWSHC